jgi:5-methylcytosine-specific restriction endonuclease McrA
MRTWIAKRKAVQTKRKALQTYGGACAHCIVSKAVTVLPRHHPSLRDDMRDPNSWLPVCRRCESVVKHERKQLNTTIAGSRCPDCARRYERTIDRAGKQHYSTKRWRIARLKQLSRQTPCELQHAGCLRIANEVHHRVPIRDGGSVFGPENLISACRPCHSRETRREQLR